VPTDDGGAFPRTESIRVALGCFFFLVNFFGARVTAPRATETRLFFRANSSPIPARTENARSFVCA